jgi:hypothetical protein
MKIVLNKDEDDQKRPENDIKKKCKDCELINAVDDCRLGCLLIEKRLKSRP